MYTDTITVFNQQKVKKQITWYPTVIRGVELQITAGRNRSTTGLENADSAKVFIKYENSNGKMLVETSYLLALLKIPNSVSHLIIFELIEQLLHNHDLHFPHENKNNILS